MLITICVLVTNICCLYFGFRIGAYTVISSVRRTLHWMGGDDMEAKFLVSADEQNQALKDEIRNKF